MMRVSSNSRLLATSHHHPEPGCGMSPDGCGSSDDTLLAVGFKRTLHTPAKQKHTYSYPHHHHHHQRPNVRRRCVLRVSKFLSFLLFLVICDSQTVCRAAFRASAATIGHTAGADNTDSIMGRVEAEPTSGGAIRNRTKLQEIVLEGLGLSALPDVRLMNISQQEYETKYAEYLDRVNRRQQSLSSGHTEDGWYEQRQLFSFPGTDHALNHRNLRRKRSLNNDFDLVYIRFDIPMRNASTGEMTGFQSPSLYHDPNPDDDGEESSVVGDNPTNALQHTLEHHGGRSRQSLSELPPISPENIEESSLNIMLTRRQNSARSTNAHSKQQHHSQQAHQVQQPPVQHTPAQLHQHQLQAHGHRRKGRVRFKQQQHQQQQHQQLHQQQHQHPHMSGRTVTVHVYQLVEPYERHFLTSKTIAVQEIPPNGSRWYQLPLEEAVRTWLDGSRKNLGLELYCEGCHAHDVHLVHDSSPYFRSYEETPVLNVVGRLVQREKRSKLQRYRPQMRDYLSPPKTTACTTGNKRCCRHPLLVDFRDIEGFDFIIQPKIFDAGFCRGRCPTKFNPATHHALLQSLLHEHIKYDVPKPCCAPSSLDHIDVLHADPKNPQRLKVSTWHNMRVLECACS
ncbi:bone morphogenetic protein 5-like [Anopheles stephensi]|uniref:bone morphogenetic protein 5-like n=1 Tax=Anopheles stephensi TaxID=30069 RepID=UPI001658B1EA|nr:bone morphogenetic protein 5-like [Anopheles stephensi]XP_035893733.1 bone morphogenetic protein 5-like [Anopheles stephensi]XP_035893735.1 bone morphogenetic protein 5-like [Anopheles stephensi]